MERKGRFWSPLLIALCSCNISDMPHEKAEVEIMISCPDILSRAADPDENLLTDLSIMIFDENGVLEDSKSFSKKDLSGSNEASCKVSLIMNKEYNIYACANIGMDIQASSIEELRKLRCHLAYPDEYREGIAMSGSAEGIKIGKEDKSIRIDLKRMMAKVSIRIDRGCISEDISMNVVSARIGNCPKSALLFSENSVSSSDDCFANGFTRDGNECSILNRDIGKGLSGSLSFYMLENIQRGIRQEERSQETCSYMELKIDYDSPSRYTAGKPLIYRFFIGEDEGSAEVERNCHYRITVIPEDDGLSLDGWRVDKSGLIAKESEIFFEMLPSGYMQGHVGEEVHVRCSYSPESAEFDIGLEELELDRERGIYDYQIDEDGKGVILKLKAAGTGIIYMEAGEPINEAGLLVLEVNE